MAFNKTEQYGLSENILDSAVGLVVKTQQADVDMADEDGLIKAGSLYSNEEATYTAETNTAGQNPNTNGWYVLADGSYVLTEDTTPQDGTTYYSKSAETISGVVFDDYDMDGYDSRPIAVVMQGRLKADKVTDEALAKKSDFAAQGLYLV